MEHKREVGMYIGMSTYDKPYHAVLKIQNSPVNAQWDYFFNYIKI